MFYGIPILQPKKNIHKYFSRNSYFLRRTYTTICMRVELIYFIIKIIINIINNDYRILYCSWLRVGSAHSTRHFCAKGSQAGLYDVHAFFTNRVRELLKAVIRTFRGFIVLTCGRAVRYLWVIAIRAFGGTRVAEKFVGTKMKGYNILGWVRRYWELGRLKRRIIYVF